MNAKKRKNSSIVEGTQDPNKNEEILEILKSYEDVFPAELPKGLPPSKINGDFHINLKEDSEPVKKDLYRMSPSELRETK